MRMKNETAIITGSTSGIGKQLAKLFLKEGCKVAICSRHEENVSKTVSEFRSAYGDSVVGFTCDVANIDSVKALTAKAIAAFGSVRILVANAGIHRTYGPFECLSLERVTEDAQSVIGINLIGTINSVAACLPHMKSQGYGRIITLSGGGADRPLPHMTIYSATKGGVVAFSKCLAREFEEASGDLKINIYQPGMIRTNLGPSSEVVAGWKDEETFRREEAIAFDCLGVAIDQSTKKVLPYVLPSCKENGKTFRGFALITMIRGAMKLRRALKKREK